MVTKELTQFHSMLTAGVSYDTAAQDIHTRAPMTGSGLACALETWQQGHETALVAPLPAPLALAAFCPGDTPEEMTTMARELVSQGYTALKLKVGRMDARDEARLVRAACAQLPDGGTVRMDANQRSGLDHAEQLCRELEGLPVAHFEQPFAPEAWKEHEKLAQSSPVPILLDESIESLRDIQRAADCGVRAVKLKLCKHLGMSQTREMILKAQQLNMSLVFGNGVQSALGNHLEARLASATGIDSALELNGFAKVAQSPFAHEMRVAHGQLTDNGLGSNISEPFHTKELLGLTFSSQQLNQNERGL